MALSQLNEVEIAQICVYTPALAIAILLAIRHGFGRSSGWFYLILFSVVRILGSAVELATLSWPSNTELYIVGFTLQNVGLSPLILVMLGLLSRVVENIRQNSDPRVTPRNIRIVQLLVIAGLILGIVGGTQLSKSNAASLQDSQASAAYTSPTMSVVGLGLMIVGFGLLIVATAVTAGQMADIDAGEKRLLLAIALAVPFVAVRIIYSALGTFANNPSFRSFGGSGAPNYVVFFIAMAVAMEMAAIAIFEAVGLTLRRLPKGDKDIPMGTYGNRDDAQEQYAYQQHGMTRM